MNQALTIQFSVISDITTSAVSWQETHTVSTNDYGLYTAIIGQGTATSVGSSATFDVIDWGASNHLLKVEVDFGGGIFVDMGTTAFMSVPYALNSTPQSLTISGDTLFISSGNWIILPSSAPTLLGCTDTTALNFNVLANTDDGTCIINGCTDSTAFNYNPLANSDDGTCIAVVLGCIDSLYTEYDPSANTDDGTCATANVNGCTDTTALNFNVLANTDDGTCIGIGSTYQGGLIFYLDGNGGGLISAPSGIWDPVCSSGGGDTYAEWGCLGTNLPGALGLGAGAQNTIDIEAGCTTPCTAADICANYTDGTYSDWFLPSLTELEQMYINLHQQGLGDFFNPIDPFRKYWSSNQGLPMIANPLQDAMLIDFTNGTYSWFFKDVSNKVRPVRAFGSMTVYGCTVISATNYNPLALTDDGSCIINGCTDPLHIEYNPLANTDDGSCTAMIVNGCTRSLSSITMTHSANTDDGSCI